MVKNYLHKNNIVTSSLVLGIFILLALIFSFKLLGLRENLIQSKNELAFERQNIKLLDQLVADKDKEDTNIKRALSSLPQSYMEIGTLAYKIESLARTNNLNTALSFDKEAKDDSGIASLIIEITTVGGYQNYTKFISSLSNLPYNTSLVNINAENKNGLTAASAIKVYVQK